MRDATGTIKWISHRGLCADATENTLAAFKAAIKSGFKCLETDLRITKDDHIVLCHDPTLARFAGPSEPVSDLTRLQIQQLPLAIKEPIMFFDEFIEVFAAYQWVFDIKPEQGMKTIQRLTRWARARKAHAWLEENARFLFWNRQQEQCFLKEFPNAKLYARSLECWAAGLSSLCGASRLGLIDSRKTYALPPRLGRISLYKKHLIAAFHGVGAKVVAFLPESQEDARAAIDSGVDEILTDYNFLDCQPQQ